MTDAVMCSYGECSQDPVTTLQVDGEKVPACKNHLETLTEKHSDQEQGEVDGTSIPVASNGDDEAAWINTTEDGQAYLSVKLEDGEYTALFPQSDALQITLNRIHEVQKQR